MKSDFSTAPLDALLVALSEDAARPPLAALAAADARRAELTPALLAALVEGFDDPAGAATEVSTLFCHALYLLAKWRATDALPLVLAWLRLPDEGAFEIAGDVVTEGSARILAAVCGGDIAQIKALIEDEEVDEFCRSTGLVALEVLVAWGEWPCAALEAYVLELAQGKIAREPSHLWNELAMLTADLGFNAALPAIREAFADELVEPEVVTLEEVEADVAAGGRWEECVDAHPRITDVAEETAWWECYQQTIRSEPKIGRNEQCPCGSGKKYKQCCGRES